MISNYLPIYLNARKHNSNRLITVSLLNKLVTFPIATFGLKSRCYQALEEFTICGAVYRVEKCSKKPCEGISLFYGEMDYTR